MEQIMKCMLAVNAFASESREQVGQLMNVIMGMNDAVSEICVAVFAPEDCNTDILLQEVSMPLHSIDDRIKVRINFISMQEYYPETILKWLAAEAADTDVCIFPGNCFGDEISVRLAARTSGSSLIGVVSAEKYDKDAGYLIAARKEYAGHMVTEYRLCAKPFCIAADHAVSNTAPISEKTNKHNFEIVYSSCNTDGTDEIKYISKDLIEKDNGLKGASFVTCMGRGIGSRRNAEEASALAEKAGAYAAGSRPCVMNAWMSMDRLVGVSGALIAPEICILLGISGAPAFYSGIKNSRHIIAVNNRADAPVMQKSDLAVQGDCMEIFRLFTQLFMGDGRSDGNAQDN